MDLFEQVDAARQRWNVLRHPFYVRWEAGELSCDELAFYAGEYRHAVVALAESAAASGDAGHAEEEAAHVDLWDDFARALDAPLDREPLAETAACAEAWARDDRLEALAVLYAIESAQPAISRTKLDGLVAHYGFATGDSGASYFALHAERDVEHAEAARRELELAAPGDTSRLVTAAERALEANWRLLDGVTAAAA
jgi:pyrroloquinoline quinone (PQQ) biosynthesis protein C